MNEIKYEAVFGEQSLFDKSPKDCVFVVKFSGGSKSYICENEVHDTGLGFTTETSDFIDDGEHAACLAAYEFSHKTHEGDTFQFEDLFEHSFKRYTFHFIWCCYAIAFGVKKYDEAKALSKEATEMPEVKK